MALFWSPVVVGCMLCLISTALGAQTKSLEGTWYGFTYVGDFRAYKFLPDGKMHTETQSGITENGKYESSGDSIQIEFPNQRAGKSLVIRGRIENGIIQAKASVTGSGWDIKLTRAPACEGKVRMCGSGLFCQEDTKSARYWRPSRPGQSVTAAESLTDFHDFYDFFNCAVQLKQHDMYVSRISFPFKKVLLRADVRKSAEVPKVDFNVRMINPEEDKNVDPPGGISIPQVVNADHASVYRLWLSDTEMEWVFEKKNARWSLTGAEYRDGARNDLSWFGLKNCNQHVLRGFEKAKSGQNENFEGFVIRFYCALKHNKSELYLSRIRFPLPYTIRTTEGDSQGKVKKEDLEAWKISAVDGVELPLSYSRTLDRGGAYIGSHATGTSQKWIFRRVGSNWYLVEVDIGSY